jgi:glycosyltransferase involved in cell wall biosynthesis
LEAVRHYDDGWRPADRLGLTPVAFDSAVAGEFRTLLARRRPDAVVLEQLGQHVLIPLVHSAGAKVVLDNHNVEGALAEALRDGSHAAVDDAMVAAVARAEGDAARAADAVWVCSDADATLMQERYGLKRRPTVVPNVVDFVAYRTARARWRDRLLAPAPVVVFPAHFGYPPNEEAALILVRDVMPALREACPGARLVLAGRSPTEPMREHAGPGVEITGAVADIRPYLGRATVMVMPLHRGSGTRFKAIEGFAAGLPVVSTAKGIEGLDLEDGVHFLRAETPAAIVEAIRRLQADPGLARRIAREGYRLGLRRYSPAAVETAIAASLRDLGLVDK